MTTLDPVLYVVADGNKARFLKYDGQQLRTTRSFDAQTAPAHAEVGSIKTPHADPRTQIKERFAREVADAIAHDAQQDSAVEGIALAAPASTLHEIRSHLNKATAAKLVTTESKDLTNIADHDLLSHFHRPATGWEMPAGR
ncbi:baeRF12 domain-containing protein [Tanticharoenia sakaeratensis]|uniref:AtsE protein n=1 Tax=Tanticharoenia sakaeratensis NBRC 103193 TaxID=1231623 RepID=A0A0D6MNT8_9PROT|nr:host attachment protein [Tanticharoenia sakaeratensis]GAN55347.1 AtsE protein [Tanticharoenia sakaeratensis NBRC 103193]GBQ24809.1 AtsE protein [Tanticharoenia sakaeratensis NBRC 103193]